MVAGCLKVAYMTNVQQVEATVGDYKPLARAADHCPPFRQVVPSNDFLAKIHRPILAKPGALATSFKFTAEIVRHARLDYECGV